MPAKTIPRIIAVPRLPATLLILILLIGLFKIFQPLSSYRPERRTRAQLEAYAQIATLKNEIEVAYLESISGSRIKRNWHTKIDIPSNVTVVDYGEGQPALTLFGNENWRSIYLPVLYTLTREKPQEAAVLYSNRQVRFEKPARLAEQIEIARASFATENPQETLNDSILRAGRFLREHRFGSE